MKDPLPISQKHPPTGKPGQVPPAPALFGINLPGKVRSILQICLILGVIALAGWLLLSAVRQETRVRDLVAIIGRLPEDEQRKRIACSRTPLEDGPERAALEQAVSRLAQSVHRATAYCLLGDYPSALAAYQQSASSGDHEAALQVYFLLARNGDLQAAKQALDNMHFSVKELQGFSSAVTNLKISIDLLPLAQYMADLYPGDPGIWLLWLDAARGYERASNWQGALDAYVEAIKVQEKLGVSIGRSSFELGAGRIAQTRLEPRDLKRELSYYNSAIAGMDFLYGANPTYAFLYRGEVYQGLRPSYTASQALQEFLHSLELDPKNYWAARAIAGVYLYDFKEFPLAEF